MMTTENIGALVSPKTKFVKTPIGEPLPETIEQDLKDLKAEVARLNKIIDNFKKYYNNWYKFKHHLGL
jgi:hypothetical protein